MKSPVYIDTLTSGTFSSKVVQSRELMEKCRVCPRNCGVNRLGGELGFCETGTAAKVASVGPHFGEEEPLVGRGGSGTVFFSSCNLKCVFCQNYDISKLNEGRAVSSRELADMMLSLQNMGCHNINFVTPSHVVPQIIEAVFLAAELGLHVPLVYNSSGYDSVETLRLLEGVVDIYMPDFKINNSDAGAVLLNAPDYPERAQAAIKEMHRQVGDLLVENGIAVRGLLVRHLVMPDDLADIRSIMRFLAHEISPNTYVNIMDQYRPCGEAGRHDHINRGITRKEYQDALRIALEEGIERLDQRRGFRFKFF